MAAIVFGILLYLICLCIKSCCKKEDKNSEEKKEGVSDSDAMEPDSDEIHQIDFTKKDKKISVELADPNCLENTLTFEESQRDINLGFGRGKQFNKTFNGTTIVNILETNFNERFA